MFEKTVKELQQSASCFSISMTEFSLPLKKSHGGRRTCKFAREYMMSPNTLLGLCVWKSYEKGVKSVWKKGNMWNQCWQKYKFTTSAFHMHVNFLTCMWNFVIHVKNFCHMCELFFHAFYYMWNLFTHVKQFCHACELQISHA